jgi:mannose-6-phosphate isomerase-like protein (cupin superfamily)
MYIGRERRNVSSGCAVYIPPKAVQCIRNTGKKDLAFLCIVDPAWHARDEIVFQQE